MPAQAMLTAEEVLRFNLPNKRAELVCDMQIIREPAGYQHGEDVLPGFTFAIGTLLRRGRA